MYYLVESLSIPPNTVITDLVEGHQFKIWDSSTNKYIICESQQDQSGVNPRMKNMPDTKIVGLTKLEYSDITYNAVCPVDKAFIQSLDYFDDVSLAFVYKKDTREFFNSMYKFKSKKFDDVIQYHFDSNKGICYIYEDILLTGDAFISVFPEFNGIVEFGKVYSVLDYLCMLYKEHEDIFNFDRILFIGMNNGETAETRYVIRVDLPKRLEHFLLKYKIMKR
jgi:hypothetical protein